jgi:hypothetical protein
MLWRNPRWAGLLMVTYVLLSLAIGPDVFSKPAPVPSDRERMYSALLPRRSSPGA